MNSWFSFIRNNNNTNVPRYPPGQITNTKIQNILSNGKNLKENIDYYMVNKDCWEFLFNIYGGGPSIFKKKDSIPPPGPNGSNSIN